MELGTAVAAAWSSGFSAYGVVALLGLAGRFGWVELDGWLTSWWTILIAGVLFVAEFVIDKIPAIDSVWDGINTAVRPAVGAAILASVAGAAVDLPAPLLAAVGGLLALSSHAAKASTRVAVNASPEPVSNVALSVTEDGVVAGVMALAIAAPAVAFVVTLVLAVATTVTAILLFRFARRLAGRFRTTDSPDAPLHR